eukprot:389973-Prorocentrum_minimum.AAC.2
MARIAIALLELKVTQRYDVPPRGVEIHLIPDRVTRRVESDHLNLGVRDIWYRYKIEPVADACGLLGLVGLSNYTLVMMYSRLANTNT